MTAVPAAAPAYTRCPRPNPFSGASCRRRGCPYCGLRWAWNWERVMRANLEAYGGPVMMVAITPPGTDRLPWACTKEHDHAGPKGCKVDDEAADEWSYTARGNWKHLREAARKATLDAVGLKPTLIERVWEPQKRGIPHLHIVLGMATEPEKIAAHRFVDELDARAAEYDFGFVQQKRKVMGAAEASRYLVGYLLGRSKRKGTIRENIADPRMPRSLIWLTPALTSLKRGGTGVTMRTLRYINWYFAALRGRCAVYPRLYGDIMFTVARVAAKVEPKKARAPGEDDEASFNRHVGNLKLMRRVQYGWQTSVVAIRAAAA